MGLGPTPFKNWSPMHVSSLASANSVTLKRRTFIWSIELNSITIVLTSQWSYYTCKILSAAPCIFVELQLRLYACMMYRTILRYVHARVVGVR